MSQENNTWKNLFMGLLITLVLSSFAVASTAFVKAGVVKDEAFSEINKVDDKQNKDMQIMLELKGNIEKEIALINSNISNMKNNMQEMKIQQKERHEEIKTMIKGLKNE